MTYRLEDGWSTAPQSVQFCFPINLVKPEYRYIDQSGRSSRAAQQSGGR